MTTTFRDVVNRAVYNIGFASRSGGKHRTGALIHGGSLEEGSFEHRFCRKYEKAEPDQLAKATEQLASAGRRLRSDIRAGVARIITGFPFITQSAVSVMRFLCGFARTCNGNIWPSIDYIARELNLGPATVIRAIKQLAAAGFLVVQRRFRRIERPGPGPRWQQASNVYRLAWPEKLHQWLSAAKHPSPVPAPLPDDDSVRRADQDEQAAIYEKQERLRVARLERRERLERHRRERWRTGTEGLYRALPKDVTDLLDEQPDSATHVALIRLRHSMEQREPTERDYQNGSETLPTYNLSYVRELKGVGLDGQRARLLDE